MYVIEWNKTGNRILLVEHASIKLSQLGLSFLMPLNDCLLHTIKWDAGFYTQETFNRGEKRLDRSM
jgi:hypothetical protein